MSKNKSFQENLSKLDVMEFIGVLRILGVQIAGENNEEVRPFEEVLFEAIEKYNELSRRQQKNLDRIMRPAARRVNK